MREGLKRKGGEGRGRGGKREGGKREEKELQCFKCTGPHTHIPACCH